MTLSSSFNLKLFKENFNLMQLLVPKKLGIEEDKIFMSI